MKKHFRLIKTSLLIVLFATVSILTACQEQTPEAKPELKSYKIGIFQVVHHPVLDAMSTKFQEELKSQLGDKTEFVTQIPEGDPIKTEQMAQIFATGNYDLVFAVGTGQAQSLAQKTTTLPIVLGAATDPVSAGLVASWERPGKNITGTSDLSPVGTQLDYLGELIPGAKRIGMIYNPLEDNSKVIVELFLKECEKHGLTPVTATISSQNEIKQTFVSLFGKIDVLYAPTDATVQQAFSVISKLSTELKIPVFNCDKSTVENGAVFSIGFDYKELGRLSAEMARQILLEKASPAEMPIRLTDKPILFYNPAKINDLGLTLPEAWKQKGESVTP